MRARHENRVFKDDDRAPSEDKTKAIGPSAARYARDGAKLGTRNACASAFFACVTTLAVVVFQAGLTGWPRAPGVQSTVGSVVDAIHPRGESVVLNPVL